jgi:hypothetical protein
MEQPSICCNNISIKKPFQQYAVDKIIVGDTGNAPICAGYEPTVMTSPPTPDLSIKYFCFLNSFWSL